MDYPNNIIDLKKEIYLLKFERFELIDKIERNNKNKKHIKSLVDKGAFTFFTLTLLCSLFMPFLIIIPIIALIIILFREIKVKFVMKSNSNIDRDNYFLEENLLNIDLEINKKEKLIKDIESKVIKMWVAGVSYRQKNLKSIIQILVKENSIRKNSTYFANERELARNQLYDVDIFEIDVAPINLEFIDEPSNEYDPNAIAVYHKDTNLQVGYIPKDKTSLFRSQSILKANGYIKGGRYKHLETIDYDSETDRNIYNLFKGQKNYAIEIHIILD